jgi:hypothetical protein
VFPADAANLIFCPAQQVMSLSFVHDSIMARFRLVEASWPPPADSA